MVCKADNAIDLRHEYNRGMSLHERTPRRRRVGAAVGGAGVLGVSSIASATPPAFTWTDAPFTVDWAAIGLGIGTLIMGALVIWAGIKVSIHVFKRFTNRVAKTV